MLEGKGVEPEAEIPIVKETVQAGKDKALDWVLENY